MQRNSNLDFIPSRGEVNSRKFGYNLQILGYKTIKQQIESFTPQSSDQVMDLFYDSDADDPRDKPEDMKIYEMRDKDLAEIGAEMVKNGESLESSRAKFAEILSKIEQSKNDVVGSAPENGEQKEN